MDRKLFGLMGMALIAASVGCGMCQAPYDYCAATIGPDGKPTGGFMTRRGSVLGGMPGAPMYQSQPTLASPTAGPTAAEKADALQASAAGVATEEEPAAEIP
jgi:hypothetical protein